MLCIDHRIKFYLCLITGTPKEQVPAMVKIFLMFDGIKEKGGGFLKVIPWMGQTQIAFLEIQVCFSRKHTCLKERAIYFL